MWKKTLISMVLIAILCSLVCLPTSAADLTVEKLVDIDFLTGKAIENVGIAQVTQDGDITIKNDDAVGNVAVMEAVKGTNCQYIIEGLDIADLNEYTIEIYVKVTNPGDLDVLKITESNNINIVALTSITYFGAGRGTEDADIVLSKPIPRDNWIHIVATSDGTEQFLYFDGEMMASGSFSVDKPFKNDSIIYLGSHDRSVSMEVAFFRFYKNAASADDVGILYEDAQFFGSGSGNTDTQEPSDSPSAEPTATEESEPTPAPTETKPTASPKPKATATPAPTEQPSSGDGLSTSALITIIAVPVAIVAAVVVLIVVLKKKKK